MRTQLPKTWHTIVNKENQNLLTKWRGCSGNYKVPIGYLVGIEFETGNKGHNPGNKIKSSNPNGYDFGEEITFEEFQILVLGETPKEQIYEIY